MRLRTHTIIALSAFLLGTIASALIVNRIGAVCRHPVMAVKLLLAEQPQTLPVLVEGVRPAVLKNTWHAPRNGGRKHEGIDIHARRGTAVRSTTRGIVATVGETAIGGKVVRVFGPAGEWHYYAHLDSHADIRPGDVIAEGAVIGHVGDTGNARGLPPHLHYGIYRFRGGAVNPYPRIKGENLASR